LISKFLFASFYRRLLPSKGRDSLDDAEKLFEVADVPRAAQQA
jgi:hypothetical protein